MSEQHIKLPEGSIEKTTTTLNLGPTHPATHGVFQNILENDVLYTRSPRLPTG
jgi:NADH-quinone oxidoreductase subunit D